MSESNGRASWSLQDEVYLYATDALDSTQRAEIDAQLAAADPATAQQFHEAVGRVYDTLAAMTIVDAVEPPSHLKADLLHALDQQFPPPPIDLTARRHRRYRWLAAAAAVAIVAAGVGVGVSWDRGDGTSNTLTAQQVIEDPDSQTASAPVTGGGEMTVHSSTELGAAAVSLRGLPALPTDRAYQLWVVPPEGNPRPMQVLASDATVLIRVDTVDTLAVTVEPAGGSSVPTPPIITSLPIS